TLDSLLSERDQFNQQIQNDSEPELEELGLELKSFNILHVSDNNGVIEALGKKETAKVLADAEIEQAAQTRRKTIETTTAKREAETTAAENDRAIAEAKQNKEKKTLSYEAEVSQQRATTAQAEPLAAAEARKGVVAAEVAVEQSRTEAEITLQDAVRRRNQAKVEASTIVEAEAEKRRQLLVAEGEAAAKVKSAEGTRQAAELEGEGMAKRSLAIGTAEAEVTEKKGLAQAQVTQETGFAEARVRRERGLAEAEVVKQTGLAEAEGSKAKLLSNAEGEGAMLAAQAEGRRKMVEAYRDLDEDQRRMLFVTMMLERLPAVITAAGEAGREVMRPIADSITAAVGQIGSITVFDSAASHGDGSLQRVVNMGPETMFKIFAQLKALGLLEVAEGLAEKLGFDLSQFKLDGQTATNGHGSPKPTEAAKPAEVVTGVAKGN
ncbi:MAG TPA: SPFH domain-containing protein, partial [Pyrinomonadaceae bacterium]|nr:SPFH domain-containing protein [Pyrinomonadaceae bacterium]